MDKASADTQDMDGGGCGCPLPKVNAQHELHHQLELQRLYLDFLANTVEYLVQVTEGLCQAENLQGRSSPSLYGKLVKPHRPTELGEAQRRLHW